MNAKEKIYCAGYENIVYIPDHELDDAIIGITTNDNVVYDYEKIIDSLMVKEGFDIINAMDWANNIARSLSYMGNNAPIIMYPLDW